MSKKKRLALLVVCILGVLGCVLIWGSDFVNYHNKELAFGIRYEADKDLRMQIFYHEDENFEEEFSMIQEYKGETESAASSVFEVPILPETRFIRIDFGEVNADLILTDVYIRIGEMTMSLPFDDAFPIIFENMIENWQVTEDKAQIKTMDTDPYIVLQLEDLDYEAIYQKAVYAKTLILKVLLTLITVCCLYLCFRFAAYIGSVPLSLFQDRDIFWDLMMNDFQARFAGNYLGIFWAFVQPVITIVLYWFVFQIGLRAGNVSEFPFITYLMSGLVPWFFFSEALTGATNCLHEYSYLVKKVVFHVDILPALKIASSLFVHLFFVIILCILCTVYGMKPDLYWLQLFYYIAALCFLILALGTITAACTAFFKDMFQIVNIFLMVGIWITPVMWNPMVTIPEKMRIFFQINPMYYIVDGFRDAMLQKVWIWEKPVWTIYFWIICIGIYMIGVYMFQKLKTHFADVL